MWPSRHTPRLRLRFRPGLSARLPSAPLALLLLAWIGFAGSSLAQPAAPDSGSEAALPAIEMPVTDVTRATGLHAQRMVERWARDDAVPQNTDQVLRVQGLAALKVTIRLSGLQLGTAQVLRPGLTPQAQVPDSPVDLVPLLQSAASKALLSARQTITNEAVQAKLIARPGRPIPPKRLGEALNELCVEIQLAHGLAPVTVRPAELQAVLGQLRWQVEPGLHGLWLTRSGDPAPTLVWPSSVIAQDLSLLRQLHRLMNGQGLEAKDITQLGRPGGPTLMRFEVVHAVRPDPLQPPTHLVRGHPAARQGPVNLVEVKRLTDRQGSHLSRRVVFDGQVLGHYDVSTEQSRANPEPGRTREFRRHRQGMAWSALALARHAEIIRRRPIEPGQRDTDHRPKRYADQARSILSWLDANPIPPREDGSPSVDLPTRAMMLMALCELDPGELRPVRDAIGQAFLEEAKQPQRSAARSGLLAAGLGSWYRVNRREAVGQAVAGLLDRVDTDAQDVRALPWFAWAYDRAGVLLLAARRQTNPEAEDPWGPALAACQQVLINRRQITFGEPQDLIGGFDLHSPRDPTTPSAPSADWRSAEPTLALALLIRHEGVIPRDETWGPMLSLALAGRFLERLTLQSESLYYAMHRERARGGVTPTLASNRLPLPATAASLLALTELEATNRLLAPEEPED